MSPLRSEGKIFYGWVIVFAGILIMSTVIGIGWNSFGQFIEPEYFAEVSNS